jgi:hypothetical protein
MTRPLLVRIINPGVPWWVAVPYNFLAGAALALLALDPDRNLTVALVLLGPAAIVLYGTALANWWRQRRR